MNGQPQHSSTIAIAFGDAGGIGPEVALKAVAADGTDVAPGTPEDLQVVIDNALAVATRLVKDLGLKLN